MRECDRTRRDVIPIGCNLNLIIEHNLDIIKVADYIIDLGPEGGDLGGYVIAVGRPEEICDVPDSYTGQFLKPYVCVDKADPALVASTS